MITLKLLDLFCGAAKGYMQAAEKLGINLEITGIDNRPQKHYPYHFIQSDALEYVIEHGQFFDVLHASPPCQHASKSTSIAKSKGKIYPNLIPVTREILLNFKIPSIIENVPGAKIRPDIFLTGPTFNLLVLRKRIFEINNCFLLQTPNLIKHGSCKEGDYYSIFGRGSWKKEKSYVMPKIRKNTVRESWAFAMGIDWYMNETELAQAIPPAYTKFIGLQIFEQIINKSL
jgi:DNA (cytosine-5)-methyltransferase 1